MADVRRRSRSGFVNLVFIIWIVTGFSTLRSSAEPTSDKQALIDFITRIQHRRNRPGWDLSNSACNWTGVVCDPAQTHVRVLRLPAIGLVGQIPVNTIGRLTQLRILSLRSNWLTGSLPEDFGNLITLRSLYLQNNLISGAFLVKSKKLINIDVSNNQFEGAIPASVGSIFLRTLFLQRNRFSGAIPPILNTSGLLAFDVSNNFLSGEIPQTLAKFPEASFSNNLQLCGTPLPPCSIPSPSPSPSSGKRTKKLSTGVIVGIVVGVAVALLLLILLLFCFFKRSRRPPRRQSSRGLNEVVESSSKEEVLAEDPKHKHKLMFFEGDEYGFDLEDLLKASAEVLGKGSTGSTYKAEINDETTVAVKRLKDIVVGKKEFESQMALLGQLRHQNVVKLIAYYFSKDEQLVISDYIPAGSLSSLLHASRGSGRVPLDWLTRFKIGLTAARGLHHLHTAEKTPHGNVKSSNILITKYFEACISDYGMFALFGPSAMPNRVTGYRAPEVQQEAKMVSFKSDVYSFGVLLLELLTGKAPNQVGSLGEDGIDLPRWVQSVMMEAFDGEVYDAEVVGSGVEEEMVAVLQVAMKCVEVAPERRPEMGEVVRMLEMVERSAFHSPSDLKKGKI
ncbi:unnamed protein product [Rhodiola kirilowii]